MKKGNFISLIKNKYLQSGNYYKGIRTEAVSVCWIRQFLDFSGYFRGEKVPFLKKTVTSDPILISDTSW